MRSKTKDSILFKTMIYIVCVLLAVLSIFPFWVMMMNSTRSTAQIMAHAVGVVPGKDLMNNINILKKLKTFDAMTGLKNSFIISAGVTILSIYFSSLTSYAIFAYEWKLKKIFFAMVMGIMMVPGTCTLIGFYRACYQYHLTNNKLMLILPSIAAPMTVFFLKQYLEGALSLEIVESARIDGAGEFRTFNTIVLPIMKPALATQAIFTFVGSWNNLFLPLVILNDKKNYTMPIMVKLLNGDIYKTEFGCVYLGLTMTALPLIVIYLLLSKYIITGIALGSVKG
ncbi:MAG: carbohydrate ABC transporter permease [Clostridiales bacterium]|nr:carbohydrate ABC transporter permease [Clostridiales bacterium]